MGCIIYCHEKRVDYRVSLRSTGAFVEKFPKKLLHKRQTRSVKGAANVDFTTGVSLIQQQFPVPKRFIALNKNSSSN